MSRLLRFMSADEAIRLLAGKTIKRDTVHKDNGWHTTSVGACFAVDNTSSSTKRFIHTTSDRLSGITMMDVCLVGIIDSAAPNFERTTGQYNTGTLEEPDVKDLPEMSSTSYSLADFEQWSMYTPELPPHNQFFKIVISLNWVDPVLTISKETHKNGS